MQFPDAPAGLRPAHDDRPARRGRVRRLPARVLLRRRHDGADPGAGREHRVQRLPGARLDPVAGPLPAAPAAHPRRPARLLQRHRRPRRVRRRARDRLRGRGHAADPALHRRRVRLLHAQPDRHGPALEAPPGHRDRSGGASPDAPRPGDQRLRRGDDRGRAGDRADHEVPARRVDRDRGDGRLLPADDRDPAALRPRRRGARRHGRRHRAALAQPRDRAGRAAAPADAARHLLRPRDPAGRAGGRHGERGRRRHAPARARVGPAQDPRVAQGRRVALPGDHQAGAGLREARAHEEPARHRDRVRSRVRRRALVGADPAQPERAADQDPPAVPARA